MHIMGPHSVPNGLKGAVPATRHSAIYLTDVPIVRFIQGYKEASDVYISGTYFALFFTVVFTIFKASFFVFHCLVSRLMVSL
jgi:hypothetical protein